MNKEIILTEHVLQRWEERFPGELEDKDSLEIESCIKEHIRNSYPVLTQKDPETKENLIFLYKDFRIVLLAENTNTAITVFPTDYNHPEDIDKMLANQLYKKIVDIDKAIEKDREALEQSIIVLNQDIAATDEQMKNLQRQLDQLKTKRSRLTAQREENMKTFDVLLGERESIGRQLAYSVTYRLDNKSHELKRLDQMITTAIGSGGNNKKRR